MALERLLRTPVAAALVSDLHRKYADARTSLLRIRADRLRLARTGWRPGAPAETKLIRTAEWGAHRTDDLFAGVAVFACDVDLEFRFVPTEAAFAKATESLAGAGGAVRVRPRGLELEDSRFAVGGRPAIASFYDLVWAATHAPRLTVVLPRIESYLEARFWAEVCRDLETGLGRARNSIRLQAEIATVGGLVEAEEILFELKESVEALLFDPRLLRIDALKLESASPAIPREAGLAAIWSRPETRAAWNALEALGTRRGVRLDLRPSVPNPTEAEVPLALDALREDVLRAFRFLREWYAGRLPDGTDWVDFDAVRALVWTAIHSGFLREENYEAWKDELGAQPFEVGSLEAVALQTLDPLLRTAVFPESSMAYALAQLIEREKTQGASAPSFAQNLA